MKKPQYQFTQTFYFDTFGQMMIFLRGKHGYSQKDLATILKTKQSSIARWENSSNNPSLTTQHKISVALGLSMEAPQFACKKCHKNITSCVCRKS